MLYIIICMGLSVTSDTIIFYIVKGELAMAKYFDVDKAKAALLRKKFSARGKNQLDGHELSFNDGLSEAIFSLDKIPVDDVRPERYSHWIQREDGCFECATCGYSYEHEGYVHFFAYCPCCGAKMIRSDEAVNR